MAAGVTPKKPMKLGSPPYMGGEARGHSEKVQKNTDGGFQNVVAIENIQLYKIPHRAG